MLADFRRPFGCCEVRRAPDFESRASASKLFSFSKLFLNTAKMWKLMCKLTLSRTIPRDSGGRSYPIRPGSQYRLRKVSISDTFRV